MEDPFEGMTPAKKDKFEDFAQLRSLTDSFVFCPKCGKRNIYELSKAGTQLVYFCKRCSAKLNAYWDRHQKGEIVIANCKSCIQPTFKDLKYCISCGLQQKAVAAKRSRELSRTTLDLGLDDDEISQITRDFCVFGPCDAVLFFIISRTFKRLPKICTYICAVIALAGLAFIIAIIIMVSKNLW